MISRRFDELCYGLVLPVSYHIAGDNGDPHRKSTHEKDILFPVKKNIRLVYSYRWVRNYYQGIDTRLITNRLKKKVFFAGEATDVNGESGTINGALLSGERAANEVLATIDL